jgi:hypothetical protein
MAYVTVHTLPGDARELLARKQEHFDPVVQRIAPEYGALFSVTAPTADGLLIVNLWQDASRVAEFTAHPDIQAAQGRAQLPRPASFQRYDGASLDVFRLPATP